MARLDERDDRWQVNLEGWHLDRCTFDIQTRLFLHPPSESERDEPLEIVLETPFILSLPAGEEHRLDPDGPHEALETVLRLLNTRVQEAFFTRGGMLSVAFQGGSNLRSEPHPDFEAWQLVGPNGLLVVCMPGGQPAIWPETE